MTTTAEATRANLDGPAARRTISEDRADLSEMRAEMAALDRERLEIGEKQRDSPPSLLKEAEALEQRRLDVCRRATELRATAERLEARLGARDRIPDRPEEIRGARPHQLEDWLEVAREDREAAARKLAAHDAARARLLERSQTAEALKRHDEARVDLAIEVERATAVETRLEKALTAAQEAWPGLEAAFEADLVQAKKEHTEGLRLLHEYEKAALRIAEILPRLQAIDQRLAGLHGRGRYLGREDETPTSPNRVLRAGQPALYTDGALSPEVSLPGMDHRAIWPRPRGS